MFHFIFIVDNVNFPKFFDSFSNSSFAKFFINLTCLNIVANFSHQCYCYYYFEEENRS